MLENARWSGQSRNFTANVPKILGLKSSSEQIFSENWRWVPLINSTNCPAFNVWVLVAQLVEHCSANAYWPWVCIPLKPRNFFRHNLQLVKLRLQPQWSYFHLDLYSHSSFSSWKCCKKFNGGLKVSMSDVKCNYQQLSKKFPCPLIIMTEIELQSWSFLNKKHALCGKPKHLHQSLFVSISSCFVWKHEFPLSI